MTADMTAPPKYIEHTINDKDLNNLLLNDAYHRIEALADGNFSIESLILHLSPYKTPEILVFISHIQNRSVFYHRQQVRTGFKVMFQQQTVYYTLSCIEKE